MLVTHDFVFVLILWFKLVTNIFFMVDVELHPFE